MQLDWPPINAFVKLVKSNLKENMTVIELGVWKGETTTKYGPLVKEVGGKVIAVDWFKGCTNSPPNIVHGFNPENKDNLVNIYKNNLKEANIDDITTVLVGTTNDMSTFINDFSADIVFIDADHSKESVISDIIHYLPKVKLGGILCGHDFGHIGVREGVYEMFEEENVLSIEDDAPPEGQHQPVWIVKNPHKYLKGN